MLKDRVQRDQAEIVTRQRRKVARHRQPVPSTGLYTASPRLEPIHLPSALLRTQQKSASATAEIEHSFRPGGWKKLRHATKNIVSLYITGTDETGIVAGIGIARIERRQKAVRWSWVGEEKIAAPA